MQSATLYAEFRKDGHSGPAHNFPSPDTHQLVESGVEATKVLSPNMLVKAIHARSTMNAHSVERLAVYLCYNWKLKTKFVLVRCVLEEPCFKSVPQTRDGGDHPARRRDYKFLAFSVEAFRREQPELATYLDSI